MNTQCKSIIVAISPTAAYYTAVMEWGWHCDRRNIPEFQTLVGDIVKYLPEGKLERLKGDYKVYLGDRWHQRSDAQMIADAINHDNRFTLGEAGKK